MNILLTSVGRRSYLVDYFKDALAGSGLVIGTNSIADCSGLQAVDIGYVVEDSSSPNYVDKLVEICQQHNIQLITSLHDLDLLILSEHKRRLQDAGVFVLTPDFSIAKQMFDKFECGEVLSKLGIHTPTSYLSLAEAKAALESFNLHYPVVVKSRFGFGSLGLKVCHNFSQLEEAYGHIESSILHSNIKRIFGDKARLPVLIQESLQGTEYCLSVANSLDGDYQASSIIKVIAMRAGESDFAVTSSFPNSEHIARIISNYSRHPGVWGLDCFVDGDQVTVIDVNTRFTGDYPFHHLAGFDIPRAIVAWLSGQEASPECFQLKPNLKFYKDITPKVASTQIQDTSKIEG